LIGWRFSLPFSSNFKISRRRYCIVCSGPVWVLLDNALQRLVGCRQIAGMFVLQIGKQVQPMHDLSGRLIGLLNQLFELVRG